MNYRVLKIGIVYFFFLFGLTSQTVLASSQIDFTQIDVERSGTSSQEEKNFIYDVEVGQAVEDTLLLTNSSYKDIEFKLFAVDQKETDDGLLIFKNKDDSQVDIGKWLKFKEDSVVVPARGSREVAFSVVVPSTADVGKHSGGVLVQRVMDGPDGIGLFVQQGVSVEVFVPGIAEKKVDFLGVSTVDSFDTRKVHYKIKNLGTVSFDSEIQLVVKDNLTRKELIYEKLLMIPRGGEVEVDFDWQKPFFGYFTLEAKIFDSKSGELYASSLVVDQVIIPFLELVTILFLLLFAIFHKSILGFLYAHGRPIVVNHLLIALFFSLIFSYLQIRFNVWDPSDLQSSAITINERKKDSKSDSPTYYLLVRWGHIVNRLDGVDVHMNSKIAVNDASFSLKDLISVEEEDEVLLEDAGKSVLINSFVNDNFDGVVIAVKTDNDKAFEVAFEDKERNIIHVYTSGNLWKGVEVASERGAEYSFGTAEMQLLRNVSEVESVLQSFRPIKSRVNDKGILNSIGATPDVNRKLTKDETIDLLRAILSDDPATPNVGDFESDFVEGIIQTDVASEILASPDFISDLLASPEVLRILAATAQANVVFLPSNKIVFPTQNFSFEDRKIVSKVVGTMVFVNKKGQPWNVYVSSSDFDILSGLDKIPASNMSVVPGPIIPITGTLIDTKDVRRGDKKRLRNKNDQAVLVTSDASDDALFIMRPRLELILPASTRAGLYEGTLTITYVNGQ